MLHLNHFHARNLLDHRLHFIKKSQDKKKVRCYDFYLQKLRSQPLIWEKFKGSEPCLCATPKGRFYSVGLSGPSLAYLIEALITRKRFMARFGGYDWYHIGAMQSREHRIDFVPQDEYNTTTAQLFNARQLIGIKVSRPRA